MALSLDKLDLFSLNVASEEGIPLQIPLDAIDEDPEQPRQEFDDESLAELAETIQARGVPQPVSVRPHPTQPGRWMLNFGARRLRACKRVGLSEIPAFVDRTANSVDQFIENEHRKGLTPLEIALFVQRALNQGQTQADIARTIGKSRQYVTLATALIDAPDWLMAAYREGRCRGIAELYELRKLAGQHPYRVETWVSDQDAITRESVAGLRTDLMQGSSGVSHGASAPIESMEASQGQGADHVQLAQKHPSPSVSSEPMTRSPQPEPPRLTASLSGELVFVNILQAPPLAGQIYVTPKRGGPVQAVQATQLALVGWTTK